MCLGHCPVLLFLLLFNFIFCIVCLFVVLVHEDASFVFVQMDKEVFHFSKLWNLSRSATTK